MNSNGTKLIVGGHLNSGNYHSPVRVYTLNGDEWDQQGSVDIMIEDSVGSVDINNTSTRIVVGGTRDDFGQAASTDNGSVRIYDLVDTEYVEDTAFTTDYGTGAAGRRLGHSVCMDDSGDTVLIGSYQKSVTVHAKGYARVLRRTGSNGFFALVAFFFLLTACCFMVRAMCV